MHTFSLWPLAITSDWTNIKVDDIVIGSGGSDLAVSRVEIFEGALRRCGLLHLHNRRAASVPRIRPIPTLFWMGQSAQILVPELEINKWCNLLRIWDEKMKIHKFNQCSILYSFLFYLQKKLIIRSKLNTFLQSIFITRVSTISLYDGWATEYKDG